ncbi:unnamed protein product [Calypogeia fissa]
MARELLALGGGGCRSVWRGFKQALAESLPVSHRHLHHGGNAAQCKIGETIITARDASTSSTLSTSSGRGGWRDFVAAKITTNNGGISRGERLKSAYSEGLSSLLSPSCRPDAIMIQRSAALIVRRFIQQLTNSLNGASSKTLTTFSGGGILQKLQYSSSRSSTIASGPSSISSLVKLQMGQSRILGLMTTSATAAGKRNFSSTSSSGTATTWTERWNKLKNMVRPKQQVQSKGAATLGVKKSVGQGGAREVLSEVTSPLMRTFSHYREAVGLQIEAFWKRNYLVVIALVGLGICLLLWRLMFGIASTFISMSEGLAKFGFLALAAAMVIVAGVVVRSRYTINPDAVYRIAMRKLNTSAAVLEVLGAPLSGSELRAYIMSGGGLRVKNFRPRLAGKRCFIIFPIHGSDRRGLVSIEVKKKKGQYNFKLLAVDVPTAGADQRLYLIGDEEEYKIGGGLMHELRDPIVAAMAAQKELEELDIKEEEDDERKAMEAEHKRAREELERLAKEEEAREQDELKQVKNEPVALDDLETPAEHQGKDAKPVRAQVGYVGP